MNLFMLFRWVVASFISIRRSQSKTLGALCCGALRARRAGVGEIGRAMAEGTGVKHRMFAVSKRNYENGACKGGEYNTG
jgi:hypothetical protein